MKVLKRRRDVLLFLAKHSQIQLSPEEFDFELDYKTFFSDGTPNFFSSSDSTPIECIPDTLLVGVGEC